MVGVLFAIWAPIRQHLSFQFHSQENAESDGKNNHKKDWDLLENEFGWFPILIAIQQLSHVFDSDRNDKNFEHVYKVRDDRREHEENKLQVEVGQEVVLHPGVDVDKADEDRLPELIVLEDLFDSLVDGVALQFVPDNIWEQVLVENKHVNGRHI